MKTRKITKILIICAVIFAVIFISFKCMPPLITYHEIDRTDSLHNVDDAVILVLAYPEAICRTTEADYADLLPLIGLGRDRMIRAGHACMVIAREGSEKIEYFDNGRYIAPEGFCRVRGENTDPELKVDVKARWNGKKLANIEEILQWLYDHPEKTHGGGTLYAGVAEEVNYETAMESVRYWQDQDIVEYGPFAEGATNCARFVTDAVYNATLNEDLQDEIRDLYSFTSTGLWNISASNSYEYYYYVDDTGVHRSDDDLNWIQVDVLIDWGEGYEGYSTSGTLCPPENVKAGKGWQWLGGLGYGAWFMIERTDWNDLFKVSCYNAKGQLNYKAVYESPVAIDSLSDLKITYPAHFERVAVVTGRDTVILNKIENIFPTNKNLKKLK